MARGGTPSSAVHITASSPQKHPHSNIHGSVSAALTGATIDFGNASNRVGYSHFARAQMKPKKNRQAALWETPSNPAAGLFGNGYCDH